MGEPAPHLAPVPPGHTTAACPTPAAWDRAVAALLAVVGDEARTAISISGTCPVCGRYSLIRVIVNESNRPEMSFAPRHLPAETQGDTDEA